MRVYCKDCKYHYIDGSSVYDYCRKFPNKFFISMRSYIRLPKVDDINADNDCPDYEPKLFKRILGWFTQQRAGKRVTNAK